MSADGDYVFLVCGHDTEAISEFCEGHGATVLLVELDPHHDDYDDWWVWMTAPLTVATHIQTEAAKALGLSMRGYQHL